jgi:glyoxylase-like metal-dependent hydrolase (beta-lactamase superfamily II)/rhodanese-related sulfurtransferase
VIFQQYYLDCLSHASYLVGDETTGRAVVVDPQRDVAQYLRDAEEAGVVIERVLETHFHADFLSGHLELAERTGAVISFGEGARAQFEIEALPHGTRLELGEVVLEIRATPGHTPESISIVVYEHAGDEAPFAVLTGDTLFIGDVGRPDLLSSVGVTAEELARQLYRSTREQLLTLPDATRVFPAHGAGSACGKQLSTEKVSTIGEQRRTNYALADMTEEQFVAVVTEGQPVAPLYFAFDANRNREHRPTLDEEIPPVPLDLEAVLAHQRDGAAVLDTREATDYAAGHLRGSIEIGLGGRFAEYAGDVVRPHQPVVLVGEPGAELEAKVRLARIGFDHVVGYLADPVRAFLEHPEHVVRSSRVGVDDLARRLDEGLEVQLVDVRNPGEVALGIIEGSTVLPLAQLLDRADTLDPSRPTVVVCAGGYRSAIAASVLEARGFADVSDLLGGYEAWVNRGLPVGAGRSGAAR